VIDLSDLKEKKQQTLTNVAVAQPFQKNKK